MLLGEAPFLAQPCYQTTVRNREKTLRTLNVFVPTSYKGDYRKLVEGMLKSMELKKTPLK